MLPCHQTDVAMSSDWCCHVVRVMLPCHQSDVAMFMLFPRIPPCHSPGWHLTRRLLWRGASRTGRRWVNTVPLNSFGQGNKIATSVTVPVLCKLIGIELVMGFQHPTFHRLHRTTSGCIRLWNIFETFSSKTWVAKLQFRCWLAVVDTAHSTVSCLIIGF